MKELGRHLLSHIGSWKMNGLRDDSVVIDVLENDNTRIYKLDKRLEDRPAWIARLEKRLDMAGTISYIGEAAIATNRNEDYNRNISRRSIYKIPTCIREVDSFAYEPQVVSLGPYHHGKSQLRAMDDLKWHYLQRFRSRNTQRNLDDYLTLVEEHESEARCAYSELESPVDSKEFIQMMLLDCCFVLEFLLINGVNEEQGKGGEEEKLIDPIKNSSWTLPFVMRDILLLENQLPFFLLERLLQLNTPQQTPFLPQIVLRIFRGLMPGKIRETPTDTNNATSIPIHHILHLMYSYIIPIEVPKDCPNSSSPTSLSCLSNMFSQVSRMLLQRQVQNQHPGGGTVSGVIPDEPTVLWIPCAKKLREAGVVFKRKREHEHASFLEVTFDKGTMEIPPLQIFGYIDSIFRNLIAFEQCHTANGRSLYISAYAYLMNLVVDTPADVQLLKHKGIIVSTLGSDDDVAILFNQLRKNTTIDDNCYLASVFDSVQLHCDKRTNRWKATLNHNYFSNPWAIISVAAAFCLLALTFMQTVLAFFSYLRPP